MEIPNNTTVYCDANFLVAYGAEKVKEPAVQKRAWILFAKLLVNNCKITASPLSFDEAWLGVRREADPKKKLWLRDKVDVLLRKCGVRLVGQTTQEFSYNEIMPTLREFTSKLLSSLKFQVVQFSSATEKSGVTRALDNIEKFGMKPRDSFHLSIMQMNNIEYIVSRDSDFSKKKFGDIKTITF